MFTRKVIAAFALLLSAGPAFAQSMQLGPGQVIANGSAAQRPGGATSLTMNGLLGPAAAYQVANPGNAAAFFQVANPPNGTTVIYTGAHFSLGPAIPASQQNGNNSLGFQQALVGTISIPAGDTANFGGCAVCGYAITNQPTTSSPAGLAAIAAIFGQAGTSVANASVFGLNIVASNSNNNAAILGFNMNYLAGVEIDVNAEKLSGGADPTFASGHLYGVIVAGGGTIGATITNSSGYALDRLSVLTNVPWYYGYSTYAGAAISAFAAGPATTASTSNSQSVIWQGMNSGTLVTAKMFGDSAGSLQIDPASNSAINLRDGNGVSLLSTSAGFGGSGIKVVSFSVAGVVTNSAAGVLASSATLPAAQFPALTGDITTPGSSLVTTLATVNGNVGSFGSATQVAQFTVNAKGLITAAANVTITASANSLTGTTLASNVVTSSLTSLGTITSLTATTINAFTLGGAISGGGNNVNNINIGVVSPGTGAFTTLNASSVLTINANGAAGPTPLAGSLVQILQADSVANRITLESAAASNVFGGRATGGTMAVPSATLINQALVSIAAYGFTNVVSASANARISINADSTWSGTNAATNIAFSVTPTGSTTVAEAARITPSGGINAGATANVAFGVINAQNGFSAAGTAGVTKTCTIAVGNVLTFTLGILTATSGAAGCV